MSVGRDYTCINPPKLNLKRSKGQSPTRNPEEILPTKVLFTAKSQRAPRKKQVEPLTNRSLSDAMPGRGTEEINKTQ
jgi:hypothetical protein